MERKETITPKVGMGATECLWSDRHACTIIKVSDSGKTIWIQRDNAKRIDKNGMSDCQTYEYSPNPNGSIQKCTKRKNGAFKTLGEYGSTIILNYRDEYYDYSF